MRTIDSVVLIQILTLSFNHLITFPQSSNIYTDHAEKPRRLTRIQELICKSQYTQSIREWTLTIIDHITESPICSWILWVRWHHPKQSLSHPLPTASLFTLQSHSHSSPLCGYEVMTAAFLYWWEYLWIFEGLFNLAWGEIGNQQPLWVAFTIVQHNMLQQCESSSVVKCQYHPKAH